MRQQSRASDSRWSWPCRSLGASVPSNGCAVCAQGATLSTPFSEKSWPPNVPSESQGGRPQSRRSCSGRRIPVRPAVGIVVELGCRARRVGPHVDARIPHPSNAILGVAGDGAGCDLGLGISEGRRTLKAFGPERPMSVCTGFARASLRALRSLYPHARERGLPARKRRCPRRAAR